MKILIVEDEFIIRMLLQSYLSPLGECHIAINGKEAVEAYKQSLMDKKPYDLICMDILMPEMNGADALKTIRDIESSHGIFSSKGVKVVMITAVEEIKSIFASFNELCDSYLIKPISLEKLLEQLKKFKLI